MNKAAVWPPVVELTRVRLLEFFREPEAIFWAFLFPILMTVTLGIAFPTSGDEPVRVGIVKGDSGALGRSLQGAGGFTIRELAADAVMPALREGAVHIVVLDGNPPVYRFDPTRAESRLARLAIDDVLKRSAGRHDPWTAREERLTIPGSRYVDWLIPGLLGVNIMTTGVWGIGFSIVQARWRRLLKRLVASPMRKRDYLVAQVLARLLFLVGEVGALLAFGILVLGMPLRGSWWAIGIMTLLGALCFGGVGLLVASRARTFEGISGLVNAAVLPMWVFSGVFFSAANFPDAVQPFIKALPLTALNDGLRAVMLEGASLVHVTPELLILTAWGSVTFAIALRIFRWT
jgi:ABC-2 type transport system permease protein